RDRLLDLLEDDRLRQQVALARIAGTAVEGAEVAVRVTDVGVVEVAVDDERDPVRIGLAVANLVRGAPNGHKVAGLEERERFVVREPFSLERLVEDLRDAHVTPPYRCLAPVRGRAGGNARGFAALRDTRARVSYPCLAPVRGSCDHGLSDEPQLRDLLELARLVGQLEERHQPCPFPRAEAVAQLLEVPCEEAGRIAIPF